MLKKFLVSLSLFLAVPALAQNVQYVSPVTRNHVPVWNTNGVIADGGSSTDSPISSIGVTNNGGAGICVSSDRQTASGRNQLCFGASTNGAATISLQNYGNAAPQNLQFVLNGTTVTIPTGGGSFLQLAGTATDKHVPCFVGSSGVVADCGLVLNSGTISSGVWQGTPIDIPFGGTNATSAAGARTNLGLGTLATQNSNSVAITGGTVTGLPSPTAASDAAIKSYVDGIAAGLNVLAPSRLASAAVLPNTPTYANGTAGVGATLTAGSNTTLTVDSVAVSLNDVVLVKNQASTFQNGIYTLTQTGSGSLPWILTRATYFDQAAEMKVGSYTFITTGTVNANSAFVLQTAVTTVGTDAVTFVLYSSASNNGTVTSVACGAGLTGGTFTTSGTCAVDVATNANVWGAVANKIVDGARFNGVQNIVALTDAATIALDMATFINGSVTLAGNRTLGAPTNTQAGRSGCIFITQDATGSRTLAYNSVWQFNFGAPPILSTAANAIDQLCYFVQDSTHILGTSFIKNITNNNPLAFQAAVTLTGSGGGIASGRTYNLVPIGVAAANRQIIIADDFRSNGNCVPAGITINGISATRVAILNNTVMFTTIVSYWIAPVPTGTTATITTTYCASVDSAEALGVYAAYGLTTGFVSANSSTAANNPVMQVLVPTNSIILATAWALPATGAMTWYGVNSDYALLSDPGGGGEFAYGASIVNTGNSGFPFIAGQYGSGCGSNECAALVAVFK